jgi:tetratricopeptide (TPR) repeat protein
LHRLLDHYLHIGYAAARLLNPQREPIQPEAPLPGVALRDLADDRQALEWLSIECPVLLAAIEQAADAGLDTHAWHLAWCLADFFIRRGQWHDLITTHRLALKAARRQRHPRGQAGAHIGIAIAHTVLGDYERAREHHEHALRVYRDLGLDALQAVAHQNLASVCEKQNRFQEALAHAEQALNLRRVAGQPRGQASALNAVGWYQALLGNHREALAHCQQALELYEQVGHRHGQAANWDSLGYINHHLGDDEQAVTCYHKAIDLFRRVEDRRYEATVFARLGDVHHAAGNPSGARDAWEHAAQILDNLADPDADSVRNKLKQLASDGSYGSSKVSVRLVQKAKEQSAP